MYCNCSIYPKIYTYIIQVGLYKGKHFIDTYIYF